LGFRDRTVLSLLPWAHGEHRGGAGLLDGALGEHDTAGGDRRRLIGP